jgi:hypothetical protein
MEGIQERRIKRKSQKKRTLKNAPRMRFHDASAATKRCRNPSSVSFQKEPITNLDSRVCERLGRLLRKMVSRIDDAVFMQPDKHAHPSLGTGQMSIDENTGRQQRLGTGQMSTGSKDGRRSVNQKTGPNQTPQMTGGRMRARITGYLTCPQEHDAWRQDAVAYLRLFDLSPRAPPNFSNIQSAAPTGLSASATPSVWGRVSCWCLYPSSQSKITRPRAGCERVSPVI